VHVIVAEFVDDKMASCMFSTTINPTNLGVNGLVYVMGVYDDAEEGLAVYRKFQDNVPSPANHKNVRAYFDALKNKDLGLNPNEVTTDALYALSPHDAADLFIRLCATEPGRLHAMNISLEMLDHEKYDFTWFGVFEERLLAKDRDAYDCLID
jgi:hypothetical protein